MVPDNIETAKAEAVDAAEAKEVTEEETVEQPKEESTMPSEDDDMTDIIPWDENSEMEQKHVQEITAALQ